MPTNMYNAAGSTGGVLGVVIGNVVGIVNLATVTECVIMSIIGAATGYLVVRGIRWLDKKLFKK